MLAPVYDPKTRELILYDIFVNGQWIGSRRTLQQCIDALKYHNWESWIIATDYKIEGSRITFPPFDKAT